jgi:hypothetical protein
MIAISVKNIVLVAGMSLCPLSLGALLIGFLWAVSVAIRESVTQLGRLHSIPCNRCLYFTGCHHLKCTVHPYKALTEDAIDCLDFEPVQHSRSCCSNRCKS